MSYEDEVIEKLLNELTSLQYDKSTQRRYLQMALAVGVNIGLRSRSYQKAVVQMTKRGKFIKEFPSAAQAARSTKIQHSDINKVCLGKGHSAGGYLWIYKEDYEKLRPTSKS